MVVHRPVTSATKRRVAMNKASSAQYSRGPGVAGQAPSTTLQPSITTTEMLW